MQTNPLSGMLSQDDFLQHTNDTANMSQDEYLKHYGKKGMKWGQKMAENNSGVLAKSRNVRTEKGDGKQSKGDRDSAIDAARGRIATGENRAKYKEAKGIYKNAKKTEGAVEAKAALRAVKDKNADDYHDSNLAKAGGEKVAMVVLALASAVVGGVIASS